MAEVRVVTRIAAPPDRVFDLARDIDFHVRTQQKSGEKAVAGRTAGLIELGESVTWEARHLGVRQRLTSKIVEFDRPRRMRDEMTRGAFSSFSHTHLYEPDGGGTLMTDVLEFRSPLGVLGRLVDWAFMARYLRRLLADRAADIKREAEI